MFEPDEGITLARDLPYAAALRLCDGLRQHVTPMVHVELDRDVPSGVTAYKLTLSPLAREGEHERARAFIAGVRYVCDGLQALAGPQESEQ